MYMYVDIGLIKPLSHGPWIHVFCMLICWPYYSSKKEPSGTIFVIYNVFGMTWWGFEPTTSRTQLSLHHIHL